eukprot:tig00001094_g6979.t1
MGSCAGKGSSSPRQPQANAKAGKTENGQASSGPVGGQKGAVVRGARRLTIAGTSGDAEAAAAAAAAVVADKDDRIDDSAPTSQGGLGPQGAGADGENGTASAADAQGGPTGTVELRIGSCSIAGYEPMNPFKQNQDIFCINDSFGQDPACWFIGVFDGHGFAGREASHYVKDKLPAVIDKDRAGLRAAPEKTLTNAFIKTNKALRASKVDVTYSGTTAITCFLNGLKLWVCNTGDSRAVLGCMEGDVARAYDLSDDHKPDRTDEYERIIACKGRVEPVRDLSDETYGPNRVWLRDENLPGLAMSRSFGDVVAHTVGVICEPEITLKILDPRDKFMILASDGVWEFMSSQDAVDVVAKYDNPQDAADGLCREAYSRWEAEGEGVADDTTCVVVFFKVNGDASAAPHPIEFRRSQPRKWS